MTGNLISLWNIDIQANGDSLFFIFMFHCKYNKNNLSPFWTLKWFEIT